MFQDVTLSWKGEDYTVQANNVLMLIAKIENHITLQELASGNPGLAKIAQAYSAALVHAGARVSPDQVYQSFFAGADAGENAILAVQGLLAMMVPPDAKPAKKARPRTRKKAQ